MSAILMLTSCAMRIILSKPFRRGCHSTHQNCFHLLYPIQDLAELALRIEQLFSILWGYIRPRQKIVDLTLQVIALYLAAQKLVLKSSTREKPAAPRVFIVYFPVLKSIAFLVVFLEDSTLRMIPNE